eukprot:548385_1
MTEKFDHLFKIVLVGNNGVGKSNILSRLTVNDFSIDSKPTIGVEFASRFIQTVDGKNVKVQIWDTAGQEKYRAITSVYYRGAVGALLIYDITSKQSFDDLKRWRSELKEHSDENMVVMVLGNKIDLNHKRAVPFMQAKEFCDTHNIKIMEVSALESSNIELAFETLIFSIYERVKEYTSNSDSSKITLQNSNNYDFKNCENNLKCNQA